MIFGGFGEMGLDYCFFMRFTRFSIKSYKKKIAQPWDMVISWFPSLEYLYYKNTTKKT